MPAADRASPRNAASPAIAGLHSLLSPGLGDVFNGSPRKGVRLLAFVLGCLIVGTIAAWVSAEIAVLLILVALAARIYAIVRATADAFRLAGEPRPAHTLRRCVLFVGLALALAFAIRALVTQAFKAPSGSMLPTLEIGDHFFVDKLHYGPRLEVPLAQSAIRLPGFSRVARGDVVVYVNPKNPAIDFVHRVVAVGGDAIEIREGRVYVDGTPSEPPSPLSRDTPCLPPEPPFTWPRTENASCGPYTVPPGFLFVMGDNRRASYDSRAWGPLPVENVKGAVRYVYWSWGPTGVRWGRIGHRVD